MLQGVKRVHQAAAKRGVDVAPQCDKLAPRLQRDNLTMTMHVVECRGLENPRVQPHELVYWKNTIKNTNQLLYKRGKSSLKF